jgi:hypothetical protein
MTTQVILCVYCFITACAFVAIRDNYVNEPFAPPKKIDFFENIGCLLAAVLWPAVIVMRLFVALLRL